MAFGYGLSYTTFKYDNLRCSHSEFGVNDNLIFTIDVTNTGNCTGKEVVMLFSRDMVASLTPDNRRLRAFEKVELKPGETKTVTLPIKGSDLAFVDYDGKVGPGEGKVPYASRHQRNGHRLQPYI